MADQKNYITPEGHAKLEAEFHQLLKVERPEVVRVVSWAAADSKFLRCNSGVTEGQSATRVILWSNTEP